MDGFDHKVLFRLAEVSSDLTERACLFKESGRGKNASTELQGKYDMSFMMTLRAFSGTFDAGVPREVASCD